MPDLKKKIIQRNRDCHSTEIFHLLSHIVANINTARWESLYKVTYQFIDGLSRVFTEENLYYSSNRNS